MNLQKFLNKHNITLSDHALFACKEGMDRMSKNPDPHHSINHIHGLFEELNDFLLYKNSISKKIVDFDVLLTSVCWHDVWIGGRKQTGNLIKFAYYQLWEGAKSKTLFQKFTRKNNLPKDYISRVNYCIIKHSRWTQYLPKTT